MKRLVPALALLLLASCSSHDPVRRTDAGPSPTAPSTTAAPAVVATRSPAALAPVPATFEPRDATFVSDREGWVLGDVRCTPPAPGSCSVVASTRDGGRSWSALPAPPVPVASLRFADALHGYAFGPDLWTTDDGGRSWHPVTGYDGVWALEAARGQVWLVRDSDVYLGRVGATSFRRVRGFEATDMTDHPELEVHGRTAFTVTVGGLRSTLMWSQGAAVHALRLPCKQDFVASVVARSETELLLLCAAGDGAGGQEPKSAYRVELSRRTIVPLAEPAQLTNDYLAQTSDAWFVSNHDFLEVSRDNGRHWSGALASECGGMGLVGFESRHLGFVLADLACEGLGLHLSRDDGRTWHRVDFRRTGA